MGDIVEAAISDPLEVDEVALAEEALKKEAPEATTDKPDTETPDTETPEDTSKDEFDLDPPEEAADTPTEDKPDTKDTDTPEDTTEPEEDKPETDKDTEEVKTNEGILPTELLENMVDTTAKNDLVSAQNDLQSTLSILPEGAKVDVEQLTALSQGSAVYIKGVPVDSPNYLVLKEAAKSFFTSVETVHDNKVGEVNAILDKEYNVDDAQKSKVYNVIKELEPAVANKILFGTRNGAKSVASLVANQLGLSPKSATDKEKVGESVSSQTSTAVSKKSTNKDSWEEVVGLRTSGKFDDATKMEERLQNAGTKASELQF